VTSGASVAELEELCRSRYRHFLHVAKLISGDPGSAPGTVLGGAGARHSRSRSLARRSSIALWLGQVAVGYAGAGVLR
jgi:hypothetical protein